VSPLPAESRPASHGCGNATIGVPYERNLNGNKLNSNDICLYIHVNAMHHSWALRRSGTHKDIEPGASTRVPFARSRCTFLVPRKKSEFSACKSSQAQCELGSPPAPEFDPAAGGKNDCAKQPPRPCRRPIQLVSPHRINIRRAIDRTQKQGPAAAKERTSPLRAERRAAVAIQYRIEGRLLFAWVRGNQRAITRPASTSSRVARPASFSTSARAKATEVPAPRDVTMLPSTTTGSSR